MSLTEIFFWWEKRGDERLALWMRGMAGTSGHPFAIGIRNSGT